MPALAFAAAKVFARAIRYAQRMLASYPIADLAALIGEPTRAAMLIALLDGSARPATELARAAQLSAPATSLHLAKLTQAGLLAVERAGRHRYYRLARVEVAHALEALGVLATKGTSRALSPKQSELREARTCYDHLAGVLAVELTARLVQRGWVATFGNRYEVTQRGTKGFADALQVDVEALARARRPVARSCLDWTERKPHLAGSLGAALLDCFLARRWLRKKRDSRALVLSDVGRDALREFAR
jgi:DNA-binding transcriptional ArsR family regulator